MTFRVLVIDDEPSVRLLLSYALNDPKLTVDTAATAYEGLALLEARHYDALFVDLNLPDMPGEQVVHLAREIAVDLAIVMMTAEPEHLMPARRHVDAYLNKPFRLAALENTMMHALAARRSAAASGPQSA